MRATARFVGTVFLVSVAVVALHATAGHGVDQRRAPRPAAAEVQERPAGIVLTGAWVIDGTGKPALENAWIRIEGNRIAAVGQGSPPSVPGTRVLNLNGKTVMPGLSDMHVHVGEPMRARWMLKLLLAYGVTTVRSVGDSLGHLTAARRWLASEEAAPHFYASGWVLPGREVEANLEFLKPGPQLERWLEEEAAFGVDFIKIHNFISSDAFRQIIAFCKARDLPLIGHTPLGMTSVAALEGGQTGLEHLRLRASEILDDPLKAAKYPIDVLVNYRELMWSDFDPTGQNVKRTLDAWARHKDRIFVDPTLISRRIRFFDDGSRYSQAPEQRYVSPATQALWRQQGQTRYGALDQDQAALGRKQSAGEQAFVRLLHERGFRLLTGSDVGAVNSLVPGISMHWEFELLAGAGLSPVEVIQASTGRAAEALRNKARGTITAGQEADLVIVRGNVAADIRATSDIEHVMLGGRLYDRAQLLDEAARLAAAHQPQQKTESER